MDARGPDDDLLTPAEVAAFSRRSQDRDALGAAGKITSIRTLGGHRRYRAAEVRALLSAVPQPRAEADALAAPSGARPRRPIVSLRPSGDPRARRGDALRRTVPCTPATGGLDAGRTQVDYGHSLEFGTFLTPQAAAPDRVLALAALTEEVGLDLVAVQDHPYQARFLDTWTLLSVIGARTRRVRVAPDVANLPLRPPAVLARSVATLDRLTGGRVELGLGAGGSSRPSPLWAARD